MKNNTKKLFIVTCCITIFLIGILPASGCSNQRQNGDTLVAEGNITDHIWSPDGRKVAYLVTPEDEPWNSELWVAKFIPCSYQAYKPYMAHKKLILTGVEGGRLEDWEDNWILFLWRNESTPTKYYGMRELWKIKDDGSELTQLTFTWSNGIRTIFVPGFYPFMGTVSYGRFIPGTDLVYFSAHDGNGWYRPFTCKKDGSDQWQALSVSPNYFSFTIGMSPTGNKVVWGHATYWDNPTIALMTCNPDGADRSMIASFAYRTTPLVLADGNTLIYMYIRTRNKVIPDYLDGNIYAMNIDGTNNRTVIDDEYYNRWANYNPVNDQAFLMISDRADENMHVFKINVDGTGIIQLTNGPYNDDGPIYSPNGRYLMYRRKSIDSEDYSYELIVKNIWKCYRWRHWRHFGWGYF